MEIARHWRLEKIRYNLVGEIVNGVPQFPPGRRNPSGLLFTPGKLPGSPNEKIIDHVVVGNNNHNKSKN